MHDGKSLDKFRELCRHAKYLGALILGITIAQNAPAQFLLALGLLLCGLYLYESLVAEADKKSLSRPTELGVSLNPTEFSKPIDKVHCYVQRAFHFACNGLKWLGCSFLAKKLDDFALVICEYWMRRFHNDMYLKLLAFSAARAAAKADREK